jgi:ferric-dicitrate binding protein FerR (iron transport regulator)
LNSDSNLTTVTQLAENKTLTLPDNSKVALNEASSLSYDPDHWEENRTLTLKGEAFFDVEKGRRFDVETPYGTVSVLGTEFNVTARDSIFKVVCYEGLVQVNYKGQITKLPAGKLIWVKNGILQQQNIALRKPQWFNQLSVFEDTPLEMVIAELEKQYPISVSLQGTETMRFTGAFENHNLDNALTAIAQALGLSYEINGSNVTFYNGAQ